MAKKHLSKDALLSVEQDLQSVDTEVQTKFNIKQTVERLFPHIQRLRSLNLEWQEISDRIHAAMNHHTDTRISPKTLQNYYNEIARKQKSRSQTKASSQRSQGRARRKLQSDGNSVKIENIAQDNDAIALLEEQASAEIVQASTHNRSVAPGESPMLDLTSHPDNIADETEGNSGSDSLELCRIDRTFSKESLEQDHESLTAETIEEQLDLGDSTEATQWVEPKFNRMRVTFSDD